LAAATWHSCAGGDTGAHAERDAEHTEWTDIASVAARIEPSAVELAGARIEPSAARAGSCAGHPASGCTEE